MRLQAACMLAEDRRRIWEALHDPVALQACVPGCRAVRQVSAARYEVAAQVAFGPFRLPFTGAVEIVASEAPERLVLDGIGQAGRLATAAGRAWIALRETPTGCRMEAVVEAQPEGRLVAFGSMFLAHVAEGLFVRFVEDLASELNAAAADRGGIGRSQTEVAVGKKAPHVGFAIRFDDERSRSQ